ARTTSRPNSATSSRTTLARCRSEWPWRRPPDSDTCRHGTGYTGGGTPMNLEVSFSPSRFGFCLGFLAIFVIPSHREPYAWLGIFVVCAYVIAKRAPSRYFLHGLCVSLVNSVWVTGAHILLFDRYIAGHAREGMMAARFAQIGSPKVVMALT